MQAILPKAEKMILLKRSPIYQLAMPMIRIIMFASVDNNLGELKASNDR